MNTFVLSQIGSVRRATIEKRLNEGGLFEYTIVPVIEYDDKTQDRIETMTGKPWFNHSCLKNERKIKSRQSCWESHLNMLWGAMTKGYNEGLFLEDDISIPFDITEVLADMPTDTLIATFDNTHIIGDELPTTTGYHKINKDLICWCMGCYYITDIKKVYDLLLDQRPKVIDKNLIEVERKVPSYLYCRPGKENVKQDRKSFTSTIR
jgi:GR25 family glycosyltransferase involved in LPS biosynthesis